MHGTSQTYKDRCQEVFLPQASLQKQPACAQKETYRANGIYLDTAIFGSFNQLKTSLNNKLLTLKSDRLVTGKGRRFYWVQSGISQMLGVSRN